MQSWEYAILYSTRLELLTETGRKIVAEWAHDASDDTFAKAAAKFGKKGWELIAAPNLSTFVFKKPL